ncbi:MAG TPA: hypothetical protein VH619_05985 [Verrucomicrobiae bacterium]|jgi:YD repeat-containing protein|nr:hypothetical protein [Verrucomicrobiae bacterium]
MIWRFILIWLLGAGLAQADYPRHPAGDVTAQSWDANGRLVKTIDAAANVVGKAYDGAGNLISLTNRNNQVWTFQYDGDNRLTNTVSPLGYSCSQAYNNRGLLQSSKDAIGQTVTYGYDARARMTNKTDTLESVNYQYDGNNNLTQVTNAAGGMGLSWTYDSLNRASSCTDANGNLIQYNFDTKGNLRVLTYPGGFWTMDTYEGEQEAPQTLHKYLYVADNPVNHRDPSGHDIEGSLDVMDMMSTGFGMQSPVIGSGRGTATAIALGTGGPDIKGILDRTLTDVGTTFNTWTTRQKQDAAAMIGGGSTGIANSWDIAELHNVDPSLNTLYVGHGYSCGTGNYKATVAVNGSVYYADAANYALWGKMYQLVHDWYIKDWGGDHWWSAARGYVLAAAQSFVKQWKLFRYGAITGEHRSEALAFTAYGYNGTLRASGLVGVGPSGQTVTEPLFTWRWMPNHP